MAWRLIPLEVSGGWAVHHNTLMADFNEAGEVVKVDRGEDLFWARKLQPPNNQPYEKCGFWREVHLDLGWYSDRYRLVMLDPDWDHIAASFETVSIEEVVAKLQQWMKQLPEV